MLTPETWALVFPWETDNPPTGRDVAHALRTELRVKYTMWRQQRPALDSRRGAGSGTGHVDHNATARRNLEQLIADELDTYANRDK